MISKSERYREILLVLTRNGIGVIDDHFIRHEAGDHARAEHLRLACEELGTMFIKLGQVLSTRADLLPEAYRVELAKLQDEVPPVPADVIAEVIRQDLGATPDQIFASFEREALGSASIGQVHAARLTDGREVVVKVRKPGVDELVQIDLEILAGLIDEWSPRYPAFERYGARGLLQEFADVLRAELDYTREATNVKFFAGLFSNEQGFKIPAIIAEHSKNRVLTEERVEGRKASDVGDLSKRRRGAVARRIVRLVLEPAFEHGVFYADPHPGNLLIQDDGSLCVIDFGKVGHLTRETRRRVAEMCVAIGRRDAQRFSDRLIEIAAPTHPVDRALLTSEIERMLELYVDASLENVRFGDAINETFQVVRRNRLRLPGNLVQFFKALSMCEGMFETIDPDSSLADYLQPMVGKLVYQGFAGREGLDRARDTAVDVAELAIDLPRRIDVVLGEIERGNLRVWTRVEDVDALMKRLERIAQRANAALLVAACIVAIALVLQFYHPQGWQTWMGVVFWIAVAAVLLGSAKTLMALRR